MYTGASLLQQSVAHNGIRSIDPSQQARRLAAAAFDKAQMLGWWTRLICRLTGKTTKLLDLNDLSGQTSLANRRYAGIRLVSIDAIRGSEGREHDFDAGFHPTQSHNMDRWVSVAVARQLGVTLPPVELVQAGDTYYVRDGHHRISVARHMGQREIEAEVTVWDTIPAA